MSNRGGNNGVIGSTVSNSQSYNLIDGLPEPPSYFQERLKLWDYWKTQYESFKSHQERMPIFITLPDGRVVEGKAWETTPYLIVRNISKSLAENAVVAKVNGHLWDLDRPFEGDADLRIFSFNDPEGRYVFWHSSSHILGHAMELYYGGHLCSGPPTDEGFYYDIWMPNKQVQGSDYPALDNICKSIIRSKQPFERLELSRNQLLEMFRYNEFKKRILLERIGTATATVYRCGSLVDLCLGPHVRHTGLIKSMMITKNGAVFWDGRAPNRVSLQRIYGISFPQAKLLQEWKTLQEEAQKRDHRRIGLQQQLFFFNELSPGSCFFLPRGALIYNRLVEFIRQENWRRGFSEVVSPNLYNAKLWMTSGHWDHYADNMFQIDIDKERFGLKPMNCPGHCLMFAHELRSYRDLPMRFADFGVLHRNEPSGALTGLTRVRRFQQDDAHIFCREDQIKSEIKNCLEFLEHVYEVFGFTFKLYLSTRPENYMGDRILWDKAEKQLEESLDEAGHQWELNPGDGAFYGPKIDITIMDALKRSHQCATIQLDFQLPERFNLTYMGEEGGTQNEMRHRSVSVNDDEEEDDEQSSTKHTTRLYRPVIIHRAILGSVERMIAILTESFAGKWPFWLSPMQVQVISIVSACDEYAQDVVNKLRAAGFAADIELDMGKSFNRKVRNAQLGQYNFILIIGEKETSNGTVNVRTRDNKVHGEFSVDHVLNRFKVFQSSRVLNAEDIF